MEDVTSDSVDEREFSGKLTVRIPVSLHRDLSDAAEGEGISLNQFILSVLAAELAWTTRSQGDVEAREARRQENRRQRRKELSDQIWRDAWG